jgi:outer membrane protein assembly factor BamB
MKACVIGAVLALQSFVVSAAETSPPPAIQWEVAVGSTDAALARADDGTIYFGVFRQKLRAVDTNGTVRWSFGTDSEIKSSPAIGADGTIYFGCRDRKLYALTPQGKKKWEFTTDAWVDSSPALGTDGTIYFGSWDRHLYAVTAAGAAKWKFKTGAEIDSSPVIGADGTVYIGSHDGRFYAVTADGKKRWDYATGGPIISSPALNGQGTIYITAVDGFLYAVDEAGALRWRLHTGGITASSPVIGTDGTIYLGVNRMLWAVTPEGKKKWEQPIEWDIDTTPTVVGDDFIYIVSWSGDLTLVDSAGHLKWSLRLWNNYGHASPAVGTEGALYIYGKYGKLLKLDTKMPLARSVWPKFQGNPRNTGNVKETSR